MCEVCMMTGMFKKAVYLYYLFDSIGAEWAQPNSIPKLTISDRNLLGNFLKGKAFTLTHSLMLEICILNIAPSFGEFIIQSLVTNILWKMLHSFPWCVYYSLVRRTQAGRDDQHILGVVFSEGLGVIWFEGAPEPHQGEPEDRAQIQSIFKLRRHNLYF